MRRRERWGAALAWARESAVLARELEAAGELQAARRAAVLRVAKGKLSSVQAEVSELEGRVRLMHGIMQHLDLNPRSPHPCRTRGPRARARCLAIQAPLSSGAFRQHTAAPKPSGFLDAELAARATEYECRDALAAPEDARTSAAAVLRTSQHALESKTARLASPGIHLTAIKQHLKGIDPKLVKAAAEGIAPTREGLPRP